MKKLYFIMIYILLCYGSSLNAQWTSKGPYGGSVSCLAVSGSTIYAGVDDGGGVYKSENEGESWTLINNGIPEYSTVYSFAIIGSIIYAGGVNGIYKSENEGTSWSLINNGLPGNFTAYRLVISGSAVYAVGNGIYKSENAGVSWTQINFALPEFTSVHNFAINGSTIYAGVYGRSVYKSENEGTSWSQIPTPYGVYSFAINGSTIYASCSDGILYKSVNEGVSWTQINNGLPEYFVVDNFAINGSTVYAGGQSDGMYKSENGGETWTQIPTYFNESNFVINGSTIYAGTNAGVYKSENEGTSWTQINNGLSGIKIESLAINGSTVYAGGQSDGMYKSENSDTSWTQMNNVRSVYKITVSGTAIYATFNGVIYKSENEGTSWSQINTNGLPNYYGVSNFAINGSTIYAGCYIGDDYYRVYKSENEGESWTQINNGLPENLYIYCFTISGSTIYAGTNAGVYKSENEGESWTQINNGLPENLYVWCLTISGSTIYAGTNAGVYKSENEGESWTQINNGLSSTNVICLAISGSTIYVGTNAGVYKSENAGTSWTQINNGLANTIIYCLAINNRNIYSGTRHGVYSMTLINSELSPQLISPASNALNQPRNLTFSWGSVSGASSYQIQVSKDATFNSLTVNETVSYLTLTTNLLSNNKTYYWRVKAISGTTASAWSEVRNFTTQSGNIDLETGLVAYYPFNGNANDESGNGNNGTVNGATLSSDRFGNASKAYSFDGVDDWIENSSFSLNYSSLTLSTWAFFIGTTPANQQILHVSTSNTNHFLQLEMTPNHSLHFNGLPGSIANSVLTSPNNTFISGAWKHVIGIYNGAKNKIYIDGQLICENNTSGSYSFTNQILNIGRQMNPITDFWKGTIDDIRIYNRALNDAEIAALYGSNTVVSNTPFISLENTKVTLGNSVKVHGKYFGPAKRIEVTIENNSGHRIQEEIYTDYYGEFNYEKLTTDAFQGGYYSVRVVEEETNKQTNTCTFEFSKPAPSLDIVLNNPISGSTLKKQVQISFAWSDFIVDRIQSEVTRKSPNVAYNYAVQYCPSVASNWQTITTRTGTAPKNKEFKMNISLYLSNQPTDSYKFRIVDISNPNSLRYSQEVICNLTDQGICSFHWDNGFTFKKMTSLYTGNPIGVAADGVARIKVKILTGNIANANKVEVSLSNTENDNSTKFLGKIISQNDSFDGEGANSTTAIRNGTETEKYFWFVAPDEYCNNYGNFNNKRREVKLTYKIYNGNELLSSGYENIVVVRPPLMLVHGFNVFDKNSWLTNFSEDVWGKFQYKTRNNSTSLFINNDKYITYVAKLPGDANSLTNATDYLLKEEIKSEDTKFSSFVEVLNDYRYHKLVAANRVDYVCHSKGGRDLRKAMENPQYNNYDYNFGKGFVHKAIFIDTPHNGSPYSDFIQKLCTEVNRSHKAKDYINTSYRAIKNIVLENLRGAMQVQNDGSILPTPALLGINNESLQSSNVSNFLIASDFFIGESRPNTSVLIAQQNAELPILDAFKFDKLTNVFFELSHRSNFNGKAGEIKSIKNDYSLKESPPQSKFDLLNFLVNQASTQQDFLWNSDWIVGLNSQVANKNIYMFDEENYLNGLKKYDRLGHSSPLTPICSSVDVGSFIDTLLNSGARNDIQFANSINAYNGINNAIANAPQNQNNTNESQQIVIYDSTRISIEFISDTTNLVNGSKLDFRIHIADTNNLTNLDTYFQENGFTSDSIQTYYNYSDIIDNSTLNNKLITTKAYFEYGDTLLISTLQIPVNIKITDSLLAITVTPDINEMNVGQNRTLNCLAFYQTFITELEINKSDFAITVGSPNILKLDSTNYSLTAIDTGSTYAIISYKGKADTVFFYIDSALPVPTSSPILLFPSNLANTVNVTDTLKWRVPLNTHYTIVQIAKDSLFTNPILDDRILYDSIKVSTNLDRGTKYYWRAKAVGEGGESEWSNVWSFRTASPVLTTLNLELLLQGYWNNSIHKPVTVSVELRTGNSLLSSSLYKRVPVLVNSNGIATAEFEELSTGDYWIIVRSTGYLGIASKVRKTITAGSTFNYDFTRSTNSVYNSGMLKTYSGRYIMKVGDLNNDKNINGSDGLIIETNTGGTTSVPNI